MLGIPVKSPTILLGDNQSSQKNCSNPSSQLKKKHNAIAYHKIREAVAAGIILYGWIRTHFNLSDVLTKPLGGTAFASLIWFLLFGKGSRYVKGSDKNEVLKRKNCQSNNMNEKSEANAKQPNGILDVD